MSEMLGNQYFLARKYSLAASKLEDALTKQPMNKGIRRKLIICHVQQGKLDRAQELFAELVETDVAFIVNSDPIRDDCPCPELVYDIERQLDDHKDSTDYLLKLAILWLYCDLKKSIQLFTQYQNLGINNLTIKKILNHLTSYLLEKEGS